MTPRMSARIRPDRRYCRARARFLLRDDADLLRERRAAHRARIHHRPCRRARPLAPAPRRRRPVPHRHRRARPQDPAGGGGARGLAPGAGRSTSARVSGTRGRSLDISNDDFIRTTEDRHRAAVQALLQRIYDNGFIELAKYEGLYCVACEAYYTEDELVDGLCPIHHRPVERVSEENYFFQLSKFEQPLLDYYAAHPERRAARRQAQRGPRVHPPGPPRLLDEPDLDHVGDPTAVGSGARHLRLVRGPHELRHCGGVRGRTRRCFERRWPVQYHLIAKDILRFHAIWWPAMLMAADLPLPECVFAHG